MATRIRYLHACPQTDIIDMYANNVLSCQNLNYTSCTDYTEIDYGDYEIKMCHPKKYNYPLLQGYTYLPDNAYHTAIASGTADDLSLFVITDGYRYSNYDRNKAYIRFVNLAPDSPTLDFTFRDGGVINVNDIEYKETTQYYPVTPDYYSMTAEVSNTGQDLLTLSVNLRRNRYYTIYILGMLYGEYNDPSPTYIILDDGDF